MTYKRISFLVFCVTCVFNIWPYLHSFCMYPDLNSFTMEDLTPIVPLLFGPALIFTGSAAWKLLVLFAAFLMSLSILLLYGIRDTTDFPYILAMILLYYSQGYILFGSGALALIRRFQEGKEISNSCTMSSAKENANNPLAIIGFICAVLSLLPLPAFQLFLSVLGMLFCIMTLKNRCRRVWAIAGILVAAVSLFIIIWP